MKTINTKQQGAVLFIALVMLLVLTVLAVSSINSVSLETRITANRVEASRLQNLADGALREGEFRFYGPAYRQDKLEPNISANCKISNKLNKFGNNKPCLLEEMSDSQLESFLRQPVSFLKTDSYRTHYDIRSAADFKNVNDSQVLAWMPYRGLDWQEGNYFQVEDDTQRAFWNAYRVHSGTQENEAINPESGAARTGQGTYFFLITAQVADQIAAQSTIAVIYTGDL